MSELGMSKPKSKRSFIKPMPSFLFDVITDDRKPVKEKKRRTRKWFNCLRSQTRDEDDVNVLQGIEHGNEFKLESEDKVIGELQAENGQENDTNTAHC